MPKYVDVVIEEPTIDLWSRSLTDILNSTKGSHFGLVPVAIITKYFFDYSVFDDDVEESVANSDDPFSKKVTELLELKKRVKYGSGTYHWKDRSYEKLRSKVKKTLGDQYVQFIEPKLVLICEDKLCGTIEEVHGLFNQQEEL